MSTFSGISTALSSLIAQRQALDVSGQNIANANTPGYTRQRADMSAVQGSTVPTLWSTTPMAGNGVRVDTITRMGDVFLDARLRSETSASSYQAAHADTLGRLEAQLREPSDTGLASSLQTYWADWQDVANAPDDTAARMVLIGDAQALVEPDLRGVPRRGDPVVPAAHRDLDAGHRRQLDGPGDRRPQRPDPLRDGLRRQRERARRPPQPAGHHAVRAGRRDRPGASRRHDGRHGGGQPAGHRRPGRRARGAGVVDHGRRDRRAARDAGPGPAGVGVQRHRGEPRGRQGRREPRRPRPGRGPRRRDRDLERGRDGAGGQGQRRAQRGLQPAGPPDDTGKDFFAVAAGVPAALGLSVAITDPKDVAAASAGAGRPGRLDGRHDRPARRRDRRPRHPVALLRRRRRRAHPGGRAARHGASRPHARAPRTFNSPPPPSISTKSR